MNVKALVVGCGVFVGVGFAGWYLLSGAPRRHVSKPAVTPHTKGLDAYYEHMREQMRQAQRHHAPNYNHHLQERLANDARIQAQWQARHAPEQKKLEQRLKADPEFARQYAEDKKKREAALEHLAARRFTKPRN